MRLPDAVPVTSLNHPLLEQIGVQVDVLRLDLIDAVLSGNKPFKLMHNLARARQEGYSRILSFGGAWSNHIHALAEAGRREGLEVIAVVRGDDAGSSSTTAMLDFAVARGVKVLRVSRQDYRRRQETDYLDQLKQQVGDFYLVPEGGANAEGVLGCEQIATVVQNSLEDWPDEILLACGTGTTLAGLATGLSRLGAPSLVRGIAVLKGADFLNNEIRRWLPEGHPQNWVLETAYHHGGYARFPVELRDFVRSFEQYHGVLLDPVYTAKVFSALWQRIKLGAYLPDSRILVIHTGGLQGRAGFQL